MVVEDDPALRTCLLDALRDCGGFCGYGAGNVAEAEELLAHLEFAFDGILLDTSLPDRDAHLFCRGLRNAGFQAPIIILSAKISRHVEQRSLDHGATAHFTKPVRMKDLLRRLRASMVGTGQAT
jgi:two-component system OmpR family response regulator